MLATSPKALVQPLFLRADLLVGESAQDLVDLRDRALDGFEHLEGMLVQDVERPLDALVGDLLRVPIIDPGGEPEQDRRQDDRGHHHQLQKPNC